MKVGLICTLVVVASLAPSMASGQTFGVTLSPSN